jgi:ribosomal protein S14
VSLVINLDLLPKKEILLRKNEENTKKQCQLCGCSLPITTELNLCLQCIKSADCCVGLEKIRE